MTPQSKKERCSISCGYFMLIVAAMLLSCSKHDKTAVELWGRMDKAAQERLAAEINRSFIRLHPECRRSALNIDS